MRERIHAWAAEVVAALAAAAYDAALDAVPVDTGELRNSIALSCSGFSASVSASAAHAAAVELGSPAHPPQPFLLPVLRVAQRRLSSIAGGVS